MTLGWCHQLFSFLFLLHTVDKGGRITDVCALMIIPLPITIPHHVSVHTITCV